MRLVIQYIVMQTQRKVSVNSGRSPEGLLKFFNKFSLNLNWLLRLVTSEKDVCTKDALKPAGDVTIVMSLFKKQRIIMRGSALISLSRSPC